MCTSVEEGEVLLSDDRDFPRSTASLLPHHTCMKCEDAAVTIARMKDPFCRKCFNTYFIQRFRTILGKSRLLQPGEKVLIAFSGGLNSRVLLHLVEHSVSDQAGKKLQIAPSVLFIDEGAVVNQNSEERSQTIKTIKGITQKSKFQTLFIALEQVFSKSPEVLDSSCPEVAPVECTSLEKLITTFENIASLTARENLMIILRQRLLSLVAKKYGFSKVLVGDNANKVSTRLLANIAQGRSSTIPLDTGILDDRHENVAIIRPLREFPQKEVVEFVTLNNLDITESLQDTKTMTSIESVTEKFVDGLQTNFPSTLNTIFRTGEKLNVGGGDTEAHSCSLCKGPATSIEDEYIYGHLSAGNFKDSILCYGCCLTVKDMAGELPFCEAETKISQQQ